MEGGGNLNRPGGRGDAECTELLPYVLIQHLGRPWRGVGRLDIDVGASQCIKAGSDLIPDMVERRTSDERG